MNWMNNGGGMYPPQQSNYNNGYDNRMYPSSTDPNMGMPPGYPKPPKVTKKSLVEYLTVKFNAKTVKQVDEFDSLRQRHICPGEHNIRLLDKISETIETPEGFVYAEVFFCYNCGMLIINKSSIELA